MVAVIGSIAHNESPLFKLNMLQRQFSEQESLEALLECQLVTWAEIESGFHCTMKQVYRDNYTFEKAESLRQQTLDGNLNWLPAVRYVDADTLSGANGVYDAASETLLLNVDLAGTDLAAQTYVEQAGQHLHAVLNISDASVNEVETIIKLM